MVLIFYLLSSFSILSSFWIVVGDNPIHCLLFLILLICSLSGIFFILGSFFIGILEIIIYAGAIMVLFVLVVMLIDLNERNFNIPLKNLSKFFDIISIFSLLISLFFLIIQLVFHKKKFLMFQNICIKEIGLCLFGKYIFLVELSSLLLLSSIILVCLFFKKIKFIFNSS
ncbi:NADH-quinone oxidoreductase subunit J [Buchnera aphidicola]|uniref:NADH-quinone oxidoreductase subunit J n=1 Tax=Buchnera aphidicola (Cinara strobi) TaxID=1921549 RepID=A0A3B1E092_9GAMM|nr:NADH-quinone oxidoreductase subunit J [Buchnera aphidicola]VAX76385.1 NADH-quinone oxidoreductase subunit J [Buchnera aphidicola (Cinara strobi)]